MNARKPKRTFQSTPLREGRHVLGDEVQVIDKFQSTPLRERRLTDEAIKADGPSILAEEQPGYNIGRGRREPPAPRTRLTALTAQSRQPARLPKRDQFAKCPLSVDGFGCFLFDRRDIAVTQFSVKHQLVRRDLQLQVHSDQYLVSWHLSLLLDYPRWRQTARRIRIGWANIRKCNDGVHRKPKRTNVENKKKHTMPSQRGGCAATLEKNLQIFH